MRRYCFHSADPDQVQHFLETIYAGNTFRFIGDDRRAILYPQVLVILRLSACERQAEADPVLTTVSVAGTKPLPLLKASLNRSSPFDPPFTSLRAVLRSPDASALWIEVSRLLRKLASNCAATVGSLAKSGFSINWFPKLIAFP